MSSSKRPGTVDYSKWDNFECSDDDSEGKNSSNEDDNVRTNFLTSRHDFGGVNSDDDDEEEEYYDDESGSEEDDNEDDVLSPPPPSLAALQRAWNTDVSSITRPCSNCFTPNAPYRCSRCQLVRYCDTFCQRVYHPIHKLECIDAGHHRKYWGIFGDRKDDDVKGDFTVLRARRSSKRRQSTVFDMFVLNSFSFISAAAKISLVSFSFTLSFSTDRALQRAAAAAAVERAMRARMAQGGAADKGGEGKGKGADEREEECSICQSEFTVRGDGGEIVCNLTSVGYASPSQICSPSFYSSLSLGVAFCCPTSHYMCNECSGVWVNSVMSTLDSSFPPKCPTCKALISQDLFVRQLTSSQQNNFRAHVARTALKEGEELFECKGCGLFEVVSDDPVLWWCPHCNLGSCRVCNEDLQMNADASPHNKCFELREPKRLIEQAIEEGSNMRCPGCQLAGRKDDACTHMTCTKCSTVWCYVCGLDVESCDKELRPGRMNDIYAHNADWAVNEKRCPMYLTQILEVDLHWLGENWEVRATIISIKLDEFLLMTLLN